MWQPFTEEHEQFRKTVRAFAEKELAPMRGRTTSYRGIGSPRTSNEGFPRETTIWKSRGSMTLTSCPRARAASTMRLVE